MLSGLQNELVRCFIIEIAVDQADNIHTFVLVNEYAFSH